MTKTYWLEIESGCDPQELVEFLGLREKKNEQPAALKHYRLLDPLEGGAFELRARAEVTRLQWLANKIGTGQMDILTDRVAKLAELAFEMGRGRDTRQSRYDFEEDPALSPTERRLLELLKINDEKVYSAKEGEKAAQLDMQEQRKNWAWCIHKEYEKDPRPDLPLPRLELQIKDVTCPTQPMRWYNIEWLYCLVYKTHWDGILFVPLGMTSQRGGHFSGAEEAKTPEPDGKGKWEPHREQYHMRTDMKTFSLPAYVVIEETGLVVSVEPFDLSRR